MMDRCVSVVLFEHYIDFQKQLSLMRSSFGYVKVEALLLGELS